MFGIAGRTISSCHRGQVRYLCNSVLENGIKKITMDSPKTRNSLSLEMIKRLQSEISSDKNSLDLRCIVISGEGPAFSAGHNLKEMTFKEGRAYHEEIFKSCNDLMFEIVKSPVPVIAKIDGVAAAAGCQLVAICDIAVATSKSSFSVPGSSVGNDFKLKIVNYFLILSTYLTILTYINENQIIAYLRTGCPEANIYVSICSDRWKYAS